MKSPAYDDRARRRARGGRSRSGRQPRLSRADAGERRGPAIDPELQATGYAVLIAVAERWPLRSSEVIRLLDLDKAMVSRQVTRLETTGLLQRLPGPSEGDHA